MEIKAIGIDLVKNVLQEHAVDSRGKAVLRKLCAAWKHLCYATCSPIDGGASYEVPDLVRCLIDRLLEHIQLLHRQVSEIAAQIQAWHRENALSAPRKTFLFQLYMIKYNHLKERGYDR